MVPKKYIEKAWKALKPLKVRKYEVEETLTELLEVYNDQMQLIEDDNFRALIDTIFNKRNEAGENKTPTRGKSQVSDPLPDRRCTRYQIRSSQSRKMKEVSASTGNSSDEQPMAEGKNNEAPSMNENAPELVDYEIPLIRPRRKRRIEQASNSMDSQLEFIEVPLTVVTDEDEFSRSCNENAAELEPSSSNATYRRRKASPLPVLKMADTLLTDVPISVVLPGNVPCLTYIDNDSEKNESHPKANELESTRSNSLGDKDGDNPMQVCGVGDLNENSSNANLRSMDYNCGEKADGFSKLNVASSPKNEVRLFMLYDATAQSGFCAPDLDKVVNSVEDECRKLYGIMHPDFSLMKLMREVCVRFLEMGTVSTTGEQIAASLQALPSQIGGSFTFQNLIRVTPQIPKPLSLRISDFLRPLSGFNVEQTRTICVPSGKKLKAQQPCTDDITKGEEKVKVSVAKGSAPEDLGSFIYIARNLVYDKANVKSTLAGKSDKSCSQRCRKDCLNSSIPCSCAEIGGGFCYTLSGLLKEKFLEECISLEKGNLKGCCFGSSRCPIIRSKTDVSFSCRGHLRRKFLKECWYSCGCSKRCGNRVVQRGITRNLQVFWKPEGKRWGLRTVERLPRGAFVCEYAGEIITSVELHERNMQNPKNGHPVALDAAWRLDGDLKDEEALFLDATYYGNIARFINQRCCDANLIQIPVEVESSNHHYYHVALFTRREVAAMEELTWDYGLK